MSRFNARDFINTDADLARLLRKHLQMGTPAGEAMRIAQAAATDRGSKHAKIRAHSLVCRLTAPGVTVAMSESIVWDFIQVVESAPDPEDDNPALTAACSGM